MEENMKKNLQDIQKVFESRGFVLLSTAYLNSSMKLEYKCLKGHQGSVSWDNFKQGHGCAECACNKKIKLQEVQKAFEQEQYRLLSTQYKNAHTKLDWECAKGHKGSSTWNTFQRGQRCPECCNKKRHTTEEVQSLFEKEGYSLLSKYKNFHSKLGYECPNKHKGSIAFSMFLQGQRCAKCHKDERRYSIEEIRTYFEQQGYKLLSNIYENVHSRLEYKCPKGHKGSTQWNCFQQGHRCSTCHTFESSAEKEMQSLFQGLNPIKRDRKQIHPYELDLFFPTKKVAIEYNGLYWHSNQHERIKSSYHRNKMNLCNEKGIRLLSVFEDEWLNHKDICISRINNVLGLIQAKVYGRDCIVKEISNMEAYEFLQKTHLQGPGVCEIAYGLFYSDKLVQVMTFGAPARAHTAKGKRVLEMKRLSGELNLIIVGGASKLFTSGLKYAKQKDYDVIKSYCDLRWGTGNLYKQLGFTKTYETKYTPHYTNGRVRWRNQNFAQNKKGTGTSEKEKAARFGLWKIYDCGHQTWEYKIIY